MVGKKKISVQQKISIHSIPFPNETRLPKYKRKMYDTQIFLFFQKTLNDLLFQWWGKKKFQFSRRYLFIPFHFPMKLGFQNIRGKCMTPRFFYFFKKL